jgi:hypothetical protein
MDENSELLFDDGCYQDIPDEAHALSYVRYYSKNVDRYRGQLITAGLDSDEIERKVNLLWKRILKACYQFRVPLTKEAKLAEARLKI